MEIDYFLLSLGGIAFLIVSIITYLILETLVFYPHTVILKRPTGNGYVSIVTKGKETKDKDGTPIWRFLYKKLQAPVPPKDSINLSKRGKFYVEAWLLQDGQIQYEQHGTPDEVEFSSTNQRIMLARQYAMAERDRVKSWKELFMQFALPLASFLILAGVIIVGMIFWTDLAQPALDAKALDVKQMEMFDNIVKNQKEMHQNIQIIGAKVGANLDKKESEIPN